MEGGENMMEEGKEKMISLHETMDEKNCSVHPKTPKYQTPKHESLKRCLLAQQQPSNNAYQ